jgi:hypothetical protein
MKTTVTVELLKGSDFKLSGNRRIENLNPKELLLYAAATCAGKTITGILSKMNIVPQTFEITVSGELNTDKVVAQSVYRSFDITYNVYCDTITDQSKVSRAINLANEKYCGLIQMLRKIAPVAYEIAIVSTETTKA